MTHAQKMMGGPSTDTRLEIVPCSDALRKGGVLPQILTLSKNDQNRCFYSLWGLLTYLTTIKLIKIFLHANSELCSSHTALFQANFVIFYIFFETWFWIFLSLGDYLTLLSILVDYSMFFLVFWMITRDEGPGTRDLGPGTRDQGPGIFCFLSLDDYSTILSILDDYSMFFLVFWILI